MKRIAALLSSRQPRSESVTPSRAIAFAFSHIAAKKPALARKEYVDMVKEQPASARARYFFGVHLMLAETDYQSASDEFESSVRLDRSYMAAHFRIAHAAALAGNTFARGEETLKKYLAHRPKDDEPLGGVTT